MSDKIYVWDAATGEQLQTIDHRGILLAYSVDGILAMGNLEGDIQLLDAPTGELKHTLQTNAERISALAFSPDGQLLASGNSDGLIQLWDVRAGAMLREMKGHQKSHLRFSTNRSGVLALAFSPDGHLLASGGGWFDYKVRLWDVATGTPLRILEEHITSLESLDFSPDGKLLASGSHPEGGHGSVNVWDVATGRLRKTFRLGSWRVRFSPSGKQLAFVIPGHILVWNSDELLFDTTPVTPKGLKPISWGELRVSALLSNYPNPANPETWIPYQLAQPAPVVIRIYNQKGQVVRTLSLGKKNAGFYFTKDKAAYWDGKDGFGQSVASGIYFYTLQTGEFSATRKLVLLK